MKETLFECHFNIMIFKNSIEIMYTKNDINLPVSANNVGITNININYTFNHSELDLMSPSLTAFIVFAVSSSNLF